MKPTTKLFLIVGCGLVLFLEAPSTLSALGDGWRGPYGVRAGVAQPVETASPETPNPGAGAGADEVRVARRAAGAPLGELETRARSR